VFLKSQLAAAREAMTVQTTSFMCRRILYEGMSYCPLRHNWRMMSLLPCHPHPYLQEGMQVKVVRRPLQGVHGILFPKKSATDWCRVFASFGKRWQRRLMGAMFGLPSGRRSSEKCFY